MRIVLGSRGSRLALAQAKWVKAALERDCHDTTVSVEIIKTRGDRIQDVPLAKIGGKGLFTKEIEEALLDGRIDAAVHSMKDLPTELPEGLTVGAVPVREEPNDVLVSVSGYDLTTVPSGAVIGTSSLRRRAQLLSARPDLTIVDLRGNLDTRVRRVQSGEVDAAALAAAGLLRLGIDSIRVEKLSFEQMVPAVGQGALAVEARAGDTPVLGVVAKLSHAPTLAAVTAERALLAQLGGGCQVPLGALAQATDDGVLQLEACVCTPDGRRCIRAKQSGSVSNPEALGVSVADALLHDGAEEMLEHE